MKRVRFLELSCLNERYMADFLDDAARCFRSGVYIGGEDVAAFEREFAAYVGVRHCIGVGNGLDALVLALRALGIGPGDEVIVPGQTFIATWLAVSCVGATLVPIDVEVDTANIDASLIEAALTQRTRAIIPVHLYGASAEMDQIMSLAEKHDLFVIEDAAQAHGDVCSGKQAGAHGHLGCFSFYPTKNLGALGDAGGVTTNDEALAERVRLLANYGSTQKYVHLECGYNSRLDPIQALFLRHKLRRLDAIILRRREVAERYSRAIAHGSSRLRRLLRPDRSGVWHNFVVCASDREDFIAHMDRARVETALHYPVIPSLQPCYRSAHGDDRLEKSKYLSECCVSLPIGEYLTDDETQLICDALAAY